MNPYIIKTTDGSRFITNADTLMDAENKFIEQYPDFDPDCFKVETIELNARLEDDDSIIYF